MKENRYTILAVIRGSDQCYYSLQTQHSKTLTTQAIFCKLNNLTKTCILRQLPDALLLDKKKLLSINSEMVNEIDRRLSWYFTENIFGDSEACHCRITYNEP